MIKEDDEMTFKALSLEKAACKNWSWKFYISLYFSFSVNQVHSLVDRFKDKGGDLDL